MPRQPRIASALLIACLGLAGGCNAIPTGTSGKAVRHPAVSPAATPSPAATETRALHTYFGRVLDPKGQPVAGIDIKAYLVANNTGNLVRDDGAGLVTDYGSGLVTDYGSGVVANNASNVVSNHSGGFHILAAAPTTTDANGEFKLAIPDGQIFNVEAAKGDDLKAMAQQVTSKTSNLDLQLAPPGTISGKVSFPEDPKVTNFLGVDVFIPGSSYTAKAAADGSFTLSGVPQGSYALYATRHGLGGGHRDGVAVKSGANTDAGTLALKLLPLKLDTVSPPNGTAGTPVTITGGNFASDQGLDFQVRLKGAVVEGAKVTSNNTITFTVPDNYDSGDLVVEVDGHSSNAVHFDVVDKFTMIAPAGTIEAGKTAALSVAASDRARAHIDKPAVNWAIESGAASATIDQDGTLHALAEGSVTVSAMMGNLRAMGTLKIAKAGTVKPTQAGRPEPLLHGLVDVAFAPDGKTAYLANDNDVLKYDLATDTVTLLAGASGPAGANGSTDADGQGDQARFSMIESLALAADGSLFVAESDRIRQVDAAGNVTTVAGPGNQNATPTTDMAAEQAVFGNLTAVAGSSNGLLIEDAGDLRRLADGRVKTLKAAFDEVGAGGPLWLDAQGAVWTVDGTTITGFGPGSRTIDFSGTGTAGTAPSFRRVLALAGGAMLDTTSSGAVATDPLAVATDPGTDPNAGSPDQIQTFAGLVQDAKGNFLASGDGYLLQIAPTGQKSVIAGGEAGVSVDGLGAAARFTGPGNLRFAPDGTLFIAEGGGLRKVALGAGGATITTVLQSAAGVQKFPAKALEK